MDKTFFIILFILLGSTSVWSRDFDDIKNSAEKGNFYDQYVLSEMFLEGNEVVKDYKQSLYWMTKSADQGYARAQYNLGLFYYNGGYGVSQNFEQAVFWFKCSSEKGYAPAQFVLGQMYCEGKGLPQNYKQAISWYTKAAKQGEAKGQYGLGLMYIEAKGVPQNYKKALDLFTKAAKKGVVHAQGILGLMYMKGLGVPKNNKQAYVWFSLAAAASPKEEVIKMRDLLAKNLSSQQIVKAQECAAEIKKEIDKVAMSEMWHYFSERADEQKAAKKLLSQ